MGGGGHGAERIKKSNVLCNPLGTDKTSLMPKIMYYVQCISTPVKQQAMRS